MKNNSSIYLAITDRNIRCQADFAEYPWMAVILGPGDSYIAGGVLISDRFVLTAPHKLTQLR